jgi:hypothetical protein
MCALGVQMMSCKQSSSDHRLIAPAVLPEHTLDVLLL